MNLITSQITAGMSINGIRTFLYKQYVSFYFSKVEQFQEMIKLHSADSRSNSGQSEQETFPTLHVSSWKKCFSSFLPFLDVFWQTFGQNKKFTFSACVTQQLCGIFVIIIIIINYSCACVFAYTHLFLGVFQVCFCTFIADCFLIYTLCLVHNSRVTHATTN